MSHVTFTSNRIQINSDYYFAVINTKFDTITITDRKTRKQYWYSVGQLFSTDEDMFETAATMGSCEFNCLYWLVGEIDKECVNDNWVHGQYLTVA